MKNKIKNKLKEHKTIMIAAGGTGGHIYPALSIIDEIKFCKFIIVTDIRGQVYFQNYLNKKLIETEIFSHKVSSPSNATLLDKLKSLLQFCLSFFKTIILILKHKPNLVVGFGGYPSVAPILASKILNIFSIIHEQNIIIGRANNFLCKISDILALSYVNTKYMGNVKKVLFVGNPVRKEFYDIKKCDYTLPHKTQKFNLLVYGGSLGASFFSSHFTKIICKLPDQIKRKIKVIQQVRQEEIDQVKMDYLKNNVECEISVFFQNIFEKFKIANLIITRAGGTSIAEIIVSKKPVIFIPFPNSLDNHQLENAKFVENYGGGWLYNEKKDNINKLKNLIIDLLISPHRLVKASRRMEVLSDKLDNLRNNKTSSEFFTNLILNRASVHKREVKRSC